VTKNFAFVLCVWDHLFDTFEPVVVPPNLPNWLRPEAAARDKLSPAAFATLAAAEKRAKPL